MAALTKANALLERHGAIGDPEVYERHNARYRAQRMIALLVRMGLRQRWELVERTWPEGDGYRWAVELAGGEQ